MKKRILFIMMLFITLSGSYKEKARAANSLNDVRESFYSGKWLEAPRFTEKLQDKIVEEGVTVTLTARVVGTPTPENKSLS